MTTLRALTAYYEQEAAARSRGPQAGRREELRGEFVARLRSESSHVVLDVGAGPDREEVLANDRFDPPRCFSLRSHDRIRVMLGDHGHIECFETWLPASGPWEYQFAVLRV